MAKNADISKQAWKFQEGLAYLALQSVCDRPEIVHWNYERVPGSRKKKFTPTAISIDPDIVIGEDINNPDMLIFVTHASMEHGSEKKFWRTVPEAIEEKALPSCPKVLSILYAGNVKGNIKVAYENLFDGTYHLDQTPNGVALSQMLMHYTESFGSLTPLECLNVLRAIESSHPQIWSDYLENIKRLYLSDFGPKHNALVSIASKHTHRIPFAKRTSLRQSICKLLTLPAVLQQAAIDGKEYFQNIPYHAVELGWFKEITVSNSYKLNDQELIDFLASTPKDIINYELSEAQKCTTLMDSIRNILSINTRSIINGWILDHFDELIMPEKMLEYLNIIFEDSYAPLAGKIDPALCPASHWLFESLMSMLRTETGRADGYGYSSLAADAGVTTGITGGYIYVADFSNRKNSIDLELNAKIAQAFSNNLTRLGKDRVEVLLSRSIHTLCVSLFKYNISTYRNHNPIDWLVCRELEQNSITYKYPSSHPSFLSDDLAGNATSTKNIIEVAGGRIWIKCQSAYDGCTDKRKELCGRIGAMKLRFSPQQLKAKRYILVLDGYYNQEDLQLLDKAGWDAIFYYDETDNLIQYVKEFLSS